MSRQSANGYPMVEVVNEVQRRKYSAEYMAKVALEALSGELT
ncbi:MAG: hypothetical protein RDU30_00785 [Desulfovibrionaceae bacterium]|nr:hypothetical protein [Desulfovibrionaceae bacterium]